MFKCTVKQYGKVIVTATADTINRAIAKALAIIEEMENADVGYAEVLVHRNGILVYSEDVCL